MTRAGRRSYLLTALVFGLIAGVGYPLVDLAVACRIPVSEACVWSKAYFPLTLGLSAVLLGSLVTGLFYAVLTGRSRSKPRDDPSEMEP